MVIPCAKMQRRTAGGVEFVGSNEGCVLMLFNHFGWGLPRCVPLRTFACLLPRAARSSGKRFETVSFNLPPVAQPWLQGNRQS
jgi:hypothetical protein